MKVRNKITLMLIPILIIAILLINLAFGLFFKNYLHDQEKLQFDTINTSVSSFLTEKENKYLGFVSDWGHWDDTYEFIQNIAPNYVDRNLTADTFISLDISVLIYLDENGTIFDSYFFDLDQGSFLEFPDGFTEDFNHYIKDFTTKEDVAGIYHIGDHFFILAKSDITDSLLEKPAKGKIIAGRLIDQTIISEWEKSSGSHFISMQTTDYTTLDLSLQNSDQTIIQRTYLNENKNTTYIDILIPNPDDPNASVLLTLSKTRNLYLAGIQQVIRFTFTDSFILLIIALVLFIILENYISKPFIQLISDVKAINLTEKEYQKLPETGNDEFSFLRTTINNMLKMIESDQLEIRNNEEKLYTTLLSVGDGVIATDNTGKVQLLNPVAQKLTGWSQKEAYNTPIEEVFKIINEYTRKKVKSPVNLVFETKKIIELANHTLLISKDGVEKPIEDTAAPITDKFGNVIGCVLVFRDFSERKEKQRRIEYLSYHDQLTGLYNRRFLEEEITRSDTEENLPISFVYADVDGLKTINDAFGHQMGDQLIQRVAEIFIQHCNTEHIIARTGGDEFILLFAKTDDTQIKNIVSDLKEKIEQEKIMDLNISISFGWDTKHTHNQSVWNVLKNAEDFMYQKKILENFSRRNSVIKSILTTLRIKNPREDAHSARVSMLCEAIGKAYNLSDDDVKELKIAGELHDIGKIAIDDTILNKSEKLSESEWAQIKSHPETGYRLLGTSNEFYHIASYVLAHHERWDGTGYPKGLKGKAIHWKARVIAIADSYDIMTNGRPYQPALTKEKAVSEIKQKAGTQFDPDIAKVFVEKVLGATW